MCNPDLAITIESYEEKLSVLIESEEHIIRDANYQANFLQLSKRKKRIAELLRAAREQLKNNIS